MSSHEIGKIDLAMEVTGLVKPTIYSMVSDRKIPHYKMGKNLYFKRKDLEDWITSGKRKSIAELSSLNK